MINYLILAGDLFLQGTAVWLALRLTRISGMITAWSLIALAIIFLACHRGVSIYQWLYTGVPPTVFHDLICLTTSGLAVLGLAFAGRMFHRINDSEEKLRQSEEKFRTIVETAHEGIGMLDAQDRISYTNRRISEIFGYSASEVLGRQPEDFMAEDEKEKIRSHLERGKQGVNEIIEFRALRKNGSSVWASVARSPIFAPSGQYQGAVAMISDISERKQAEECLSIRAGQQAAVADLGLKAISGADLPTLFEAAVALIPKNLKVEYCKVLELLPGGRSLRLRAGVGWRPGLVGAALVDAGLDSQAGYTLSVTEPVIVTDLRTETRFSGPSLLHEHGVVSGLNVIIPGSERPFGLLGAHTSRRQTFTQDDISFLQAVANVLAGAIEINRSEQALRESAQKLRFLTSQLLIAQEKERQKLSLELHEDLGQILQALKMQTTYIKQRLPDDQPDLNAKCADLLLHLNGIIDRIRGLSWELRPNMLEDLGLMASLRHLIDDFCKQGNFEGCQTDFDEIDEVFPPSAQLNIFRIFQEALSNIGEHSQASHIVLAIKRQPDSIDFILADNGKGFDFEEVMSHPDQRGGLGLYALEERVKTLGGSLRITSRPKWGTELRFALPMPAHARPRS